MCEARFVVPTHADLMRIFALVALMALSGCISFVKTDYVTNQETTSLRLCGFYEMSGDEVVYSSPGCPVTQLNVSFEATETWQVELPANLTGLLLRLEVDSQGTGAFRLELDASGFHGQVEGRNLVRDDGSVYVLDLPGGTSEAWVASLCGAPSATVRATVEGEMGSARLFLDAIVTGEVLNATGGTQYYAGLGPKATCNGYWSHASLVPPGVVGPPVTATAPTEIRRVATLPQP